LKTEYQITAIIINEVKLFLKNEIITMNLSKTNADVFTSIILRRSYWNLLRFLCLYLC